MDKVIEILKKVNPRIVENMDDIVSGGMLDSIELVEIVSEIEEVFEIEIPIEDISPENFNSVEAIQKMIEKLR